LSKQVGGRATFQIRFALFSKRRLKQVQGVCSQESATVFLLDKAKHMLVGGDDVELVVGNDDALGDRKISCGLPDTTPLGKTLGASAKGKAFPSQVVHTPGVLSVSCVECILNRVLKAGITLPSIFDCCNARLQA
jgi:hypothetical protein